MSDVPLPTSYYSLPYPDDDITVFNAKQMHAYAAAVSAADNARLREAIQHYEAALKEAWPEGAKGKSFEHWNAARIAVQGSQP
jgi:hypothetical protein